MYQYRFEKLRVYQHAVNLVEQIYQITKTFPKEEQFPLTSQLKRSATSIVLNIAEGSGGLGDKEYKNFLRIALKSDYETIACLKLAERLFNIRIDETLELCNTIGKELHTLLKSLNKDN